MTPEEVVFCENVTVAGSHPAKFNVFETAQRVVQEGVEGCFVEAGACGGGQIAVMDYALQRHGRQRILHAFDSWEGIPKATEEDDPPQKAEYGVRVSSDPLTSSGKLVTSLENFWNNMRRWGARTHNIRAHKGWLQDTLPKWEPEPIALLRIDVDLTDSVRQCAQWLYPKLMTGGYCIFDDWYTSWSPQRQVMIDAVGPWLPEAVVPVEGNPGTVWWKKP